MGTDTRVKLNATTIPKLPHAEPGKRRLFYDDDERSFAVRVNDSGEKVFYFCKRGTVTKDKASKHYGKSVWFKKKIGPVPDDLRGRANEVDKARQLARDWASKIDYGYDPFLAEEAGQEEMTLGQLFEQYIIRHMEKKRTTSDATRKEFERDFGAWSGRRLSSITHDDCERMHGKLGAEKGIYTANRRVQLLRALFNKAKQWKLYDGENPCQGITLFEEKSRDRFLTDEEAGRLLKVLNQDHDRDIRDFICLTLFTGLRKNNVLAIRWENVDLVAGTLFIPETKNGTSQIIKLSADEIALFAARIEHLILKGYSCPQWPRTARPGKESTPTQFVFPGTGETGHLADPKRQWTRVRKLANIPDVHIHDLRRSLASTMASNNVSLPLIQKALHHADAKTTLAVYARTAKDAERDARAVAHTVWKEAAKKAVKDDEKVIPIKAAQ